MVEFYWDKRVQRYRYKQGPGAGQFVPKTALENLTRKAIAQTYQTLQNIGTQLEKESISLSEWELQTARILKELHLQNYILGKGGKAQMNQRDYGLLGRRLQDEYRHLRQFSQDIQQKGISSASFRQRLQLYASSARGSYEKARGQGHSEAGYRYERRIRHVSESCIPCLQYEAQGWQLIGSLPDPTERCTCRTNCKCTKEYAVERPGDFGMIMIKPTNFWDLHYDHLCQ